MTAARNKRTVETWRDEIVPRKDFQCACGCKLQISRGDLTDANRVAILFDGNPRTGGVVYTLFPQSRAVLANDPEPVEDGLCPRCDAIVELPTFAAKLLREHKAPWPICAECRKPSTEPAHHAREYWE